MKWLIITTRGKNPGDDFARIGVQNLVLYVDPEAQITLIDKEIRSEIGTPRPFDKCIVAGMPLFWSFNGNDTDTCPWWEHYIGWLSERRNDFMVLGGGSFQPWPDERRGLSRSRFLENHMKLKGRAWAIFMRDSVCNQVMFMNRLPVKPCPSIFAGIDSIEVRLGKTGEPLKDLKLLNIMPNGAHYPEFNPEEAEKWRGMRDKVLFSLIPSGFVGVRHHRTEAIAPTDYTGTRGTYGRCNKYFGNRIHGAIMARAAGADAWCVGYDSRLKAVELVGGRTCLPSEVDFEELKEWGEAPNSQEPLDMGKHFEEQAAIVKRFMEA